MAVGNNYAQRRTQRADNYFHVQQRRGVIAHSLCCLLPSNGMPRELQQAPIRFEGHKQVAKFPFYSRVMEGQTDYQQENNGPDLSTAHSAQKQKHCSHAVATVFG